MINHYFVISECQALYLRYCKEIFEVNFFCDFCIIMKIFDYENLGLYGTRKERLLNKPSFDIKHVLMHTRTH